MNSKTTFIYVLKCPDTNNIKYVGKSNNPKVRFIHHLLNKNNHGTPKYKWIQRLKSSNKKPILEIIAEVSIEEWQYWEKFYIIKYKNEGYELVNYTDGGDGLTFGNQTSFKSGNNAIPVVCLDLDGTFISEYNSIKEAEQLTNINSINACIYGTQKTACNLLWLKKEKYINMTINDLKVFVNTMNKKMTGKTNKGRLKGVSPKNKDKKYKIKKTSKRLKPIYKIDIITSDILQEYPSAVYAKEEHGMAIYNVLYGKNKTAYGYKWKYKY